MPWRFIKKKKANDSERFEILLILKLKNEMKKQARIQA